MHHCVKINSIWKMFYFVAKFTRKKRQAWAFRQTEPKNNLVLVKNLYYDWFQLLHGWFQVASWWFQVIPRFKKKINLTHLIPENLV